MGDATNGGISPIRVGVSAAPAGDGTGVNDSGRGARVTVATGEGEAANGDSSGACAAPAGNGSGVDNAGGDVSVAVSTGESAGDVGNGARVDVGALPAILAATGVAAGSCATGGGWVN